MIGWLCADLDCGIVLLALNITAQKNPARDSLGLKLPRCGGTLIIGVSGLAAVLYTATSSSTSLANRFRATCRRRLIVPTGAWNSSAISISERPFT